MGSLKNHLFLGFPWIFLVLGRTSKGRKSKKTDFSKITILLLGILTLLIQSGCGGADLKGLAFVHGYCIGNNGVLLIDAQVDKCCTAGSSSDNSATDLKYTLNTSETGDLTTPCPGTPDDIFGDLSLRGASTQNTISSLVTNINNLKGQMGSNSPTGNLATTTPGSINYNPYNDPNAFGDASLMKLGASAGDNTPQRSNIANAKSGGVTGMASSGAPGSRSGQMSIGGGGGLLSSAIDAASDALGLSKSNQVATTGMDTMGAYTSGGGSGGVGGGGGGRPNNDVDGSNIDWGLGKGANGAKMAAANVGESFETVDPSDYFNRMGASKSIFKEIEEKYRQKSPSLTDQTK
jgi:hypothetical protein